MLSTAGTGGGCSTLAVVRIGVPQCLGVFSNPPGNLASRHETSNPVAQRNAPGTFVLPVRQTVVKRSLLVSGSPSEQRRFGHNDFRTTWRTSVLPLIRCATRIDGSCRRALTGPSERPAVLFWRRRGRGVRRPWWCPGEDGGGAFRAVGIESLKRHLERHCGRLKAAAHEGASDSDSDIGVDYEHCLTCWPIRVRTFRGHSRYARLLVSSSADGRGYRAAVRGDRAAGRQVLGLAAT